MLVKTDEIWRTYFWVHSGRTQLQLHFQQSLCNTLTWNIIICLAELKQTVSRIEVWSLTIRLLLQPPVSGVAVSLLVSGLTVDTLSTFCDGFMVYCVNLMKSKFLHLRFFSVWLFLSPKCNLSETFYQLWALRWWSDGRNHSQTRSCFLYRCAKNHSI